MRISKTERAAIRTYAERHAFIYRVTAAGEVHLYGPMPNATVSGWWLFAQTVAEALARIKGENLK